MRLDCYIPQLEGVRCRRRWRKSCHVSSLASSFLPALGRALTKKIWWWWIRFRPLHNKPLPPVPQNLSLLFALGTISSSRENITTGMTKAFVLKNKNIYFERRNFDGGKVFRSNGTGRVGKLLVAAIIFDQQSRNREKRIKMTERRSGRPTIRCWLLALIHFSLRSSYRLRFSRRRVHAGSAFSFLFFISLHFRSSREMKRHWAPRLFTVALSANDSWKLWLSLINNGKKMAQLSLSTGLRKGKRKKKLLFGAPPSEIHVHDVVDAVSLLLLLNGLS